MREKNYLEKKTLELAREYDAVFVEDIDMKVISQGLHPGKSTLDNGYGMFRNMLEYKLNDKGKVFLKVDRFFP